MKYVVSVGACGFVPDNDLSWELICETTWSLKAPVLCGGWEDQDM